MKKPEVLYIASQTKGIKELVPMKGNHRGGNEGAVIFSTPDKALASIFLIKNHNDSWMNLGYFEDVPYVVMRMDKEEFIKQDEGGSIYEVPSSSFDFNPNLGMREKEWTSSVPVRPFREIPHESSLDTIIENGVNVYFVDKKTFGDINDSKDHGLRILNSLRSENEERNQVIKSLPNYI